MADQQAHRFVWISAADGGHDRIMPYVVGDMHTQRNALRDELEEHANKIEAIQEEAERAREMPAC